MTDVADIFAMRHHTANWQLGPNGGAHPAVTVEYRAFLERFVRMNCVRSIVDLGGSEWLASRPSDLEGVHYRRMDVVADLAGRSGETMPSRIVDLPRADLLIVKDVLQHLPDRTIMQVLDAARSRFRFALLTNSFRKEGAPAQAYDIGPGDFRTLDLTQAPYHAKGAYVLEMWGEWERIRTLLITGVDEPDGH